MAQLDLASVGPRRRLAAEDAPLRHMDLTLAVGAIALAIFGLLMVYSATHRSLHDFGRDPGYDMKKQAVFMVLGIVAMVTAMVVKP